MYDGRRKAVRRPGRFPAALVQARSRFLRAAASSAYFRGEAPSWCLAVRGPLQHGTPTVLLGRLSPQVPLLDAAGHHAAAGLPPVDALRAATANPARRFSPHDRGRIAEGLRADLLLVDGDPTTDIDDTPDIRAVRRRGTRLAAQ
ncbi:amidohydrolase family protein [Streptomyces sp. GC420]|nr:amidohydrolase family protein [Streptomyces sp. GC420]